ncbi:MAG: hypothetical protein RJA36_3694 [Pseudomonadota bacterium]|jgi:hypothetical protein
MTSTNAPTSTLIVKKSSATNQGAIPERKSVEKDGMVMHAPRKRVLRPRRDAFIDNHLRKGPTDDVPEAATFVLEGDQEVSIYDAEKNPLGVFDLISDTPAVWLKKA